jgi:hypothetical protein
MVYHDGEYAVRGFNGHYTPCLGIGRTYALAVA